MNSWIAKLPAPVRHFVAVFVGAALTVFAEAVRAAGGVSGVDWLHTADVAVAGGITAGAVAVGLLAATPLTNAYGLGVEKPEADPWYPTQPTEQELPYQGTPPTLAGPPINFDTTGLEHSEPAEEAPEAPAGGAS